MALETPIRPRVGVPWRTAREEAAGNRPKIENYCRAVREAGGEPVPVSLLLPDEELARLARSLDAVVLPGSPADVDAGRYGERPCEKCASADPQRERTDYALLDHAFAARKPVLAICYGTQLLNVYVGGTLIQDIPSEIETRIQHSRKPGEPDPYHAARIVADSRLGQLAGAAEARVNSSHHQSVCVAGPGLRITAVAPDGVVEAVEWTGADNWIVGVQWHPERMRGDALAEALFRGLVSAARGALAGLGK